MLSEVAACLSSTSPQLQLIGVVCSRLALDVALTIPHNQIYIMPVKLDECTIPDEIARYHVINFTTFSRKKLNKSFLVL